MLGRDRQAARLAPLDQLAAGGLGGALGAPAGAAIPGLGRVAALFGHLYTQPTTRTEVAAVMRIPWHETLIYELHPKGYTKLNRNIPESLRGTYLGLATEPAIRHLTSLGVTAVELMPVHITRTSGTSYSAACTTTGATTRSPTSRRTCAAPPLRRRSKACASSR